MLDRFNRNINYLRISVTDRCNLRCRYCMPEEGVQQLKHQDILSFEEIVDITNEAVKLGIEKVRITGGEPLVRKGIVNLVRMISGIQGIKDLSLTTNAILLEDMAKPLYDAGLKRINISLDTVDPDEYYEITRGGDIKKVIRGIVAAQKAGMNPIKINCVIGKSGSEINSEGVRLFCEKMGLEARFINLMHLETGNFSIVNGGSGGDCLNCNRLRLTADGKIKPCLFNDYEIDIRKLGVVEALTKAIRLKPECGSVNLQNKFYNIGG